MNEDLGTPTGDVQADSAAPEQDGFRAIKGEMNRKFDKVGSQIEAQMEMNRQLLEQVKALTTPPAPRQEQNQGIDPNLMYTNPALYQQKLAEQIKAEMRHELTTSNQVQSRQQSTIAELVSEYPELSDANNELTKKTVELYNRMPDYEKSNPAALRAAAFKAASELDVKPKHKRPVEEFTGNDGYDRPQQRRAPTKLNPLTEEFGRAIGLDMDDPAVKARVLERSKRDWKHPQTPISTKKRK